jgi:hypothetical protein
MTAPSWSTTERRWNGIVAIVVVSSEERLLRVKGAQLSVPLCLHLLQSQKAQAIQLRWVEWMVLR